MHSWKPNAKSEDLLTFHNFHHGLVCYLPVYLGKCSREADLIGKQTTSPTILRVSHFKVLPQSSPDFRLSFLVSSVKVPGALLIPGIMSAFLGFCVWLIGWSFCVMLFFWGRVSDSKFLILLAPLQKCSDYGLVPPYLAEKWLMFPKSCVQNSI